jgi:glycosyltransferase involved in cell wall biosynthesis
MNTTISIIVPCYNAPQFLLRLLAELPRQTYPHGLIEVVVVDDASTQPVNHIVAEMSGSFTDFRRIYLVQHDLNRGRAAARNSGILNSTGDLLLFNDVDDFPDPDFIERIVARHLAEPRTAVRGNIQVLPEICARSAFLRYRNSRFLGPRKHQQGKFKLNYTNLSPCFFATSGSSVMRADLLVVGYFDERFTGYGGEDEEMGYRLFQSGVRIVFEEQAHIWDGDDTTTLDRTCERYRNYGQFGARLLLTTHPDYLSYTSLRWHEPVDPQRDSLKISLIKKSISYILRPALAGMLQRLLKAIDRRRFMLNPPGIFYQYVLRTYYQQGVQERQAKAGSFPTRNAKSS